MKTNSLKTIVSIASIMVCLISVNSSFAQRYYRRLPDKLLTQESIDETSNTYTVPVSTDVEVNSDKSALCINGANISRCKSVNIVGSGLKNGVKLTNSILVNRSYVGASVFNTSKSLAEMFKQRSSISFK